MTLKELETLYTSLTPENVKSFLKCIHSSYSGGEVNTLSLLGFLERILTEFRPEGNRICSLRGQVSSQDRDNLTLHGKIAAAMMVILQQTRSYSDLRDKTLLFLSYSAAVVKTKYDFAALFINSLCYRIIETGLSWGTLQEAESLDVICYSLAAGIRFDENSSDSFSFSGKGKVECRDGQMKIYSSDIGEAGNQAFSVLDDKVVVITRNSREERLKSSEQDSVEALSRFSETFLETQGSFVQERSRNKDYKVGDIVSIMITGVTQTEDTLLCSIVDLNVHAEGKIIDEEVLKGTWTKDLIPYICDGDCICNAVIVGKENKDFLFSIRDTYVAYAKKTAEEDSRNDIVMEAIVSDVKPDWHGGRITWMTPSGYGGVSLPLEGRELKPGDKAIMSVLNVQGSSSAVFINLSPPRYGYDSIDRPFDSADDVLAKFVTTSKTILGVKKDDKDDKTRKKRQETVRLFASVLANRSARKISLNTYRQRLVSLFLLNLIGDKAFLDALIQETYYLQCCISFAQGNRVPSVRPYVLDDSQEMILRLLSLWDATEEDLLNHVASIPVHSIPGKIASLLLGMKISIRFRDEITAEEDVVRKKICSLLGVGGMFLRSADVKTGKYGKTESHEVEFKSSYIYRNDGKGPDIDYQGRGQVFEAVCGFLNANGGTVYLGVKDNGDPIVEKDSGLYADIDWLRANYKSLNGMRARQLGHPINEVKDFDSYIQFLNSEKDLYFKDSLLRNITIEVTDDADAIRITVEPSEYEIAYLYPDKTLVNGRAFVRDGGRTVEMSRVQKERRLASLKKITKEMGFVVAIQEAIDRQGKLVFKGYSSGNSGEVKDRLVVPVNLFYNDENVYCYDLASRKYKQFRLHRISSIETSPETYPMQKSSPKKADVFRWLNDGGRTYHIKLRMDVGARNYLLEEYSCAEHLPVTELYEEKKNKWILDTLVNGLGAVRRFYLGLADKIEILETEDSAELKKCISDYVEKYIKD